MPCSAETRLVLRGVPKKVSNSYAGRIAQPDWEVLVD